MRLRNIFLKHHLLKEANLWIECHQFLRQRQLTFHRQIKTQVLKSLILRSLKKLQFLWLKSNERGRENILLIIDRVQEKLLENNIQVSYPKYQSKREEMMFSPPQTKLRKKFKKKIYFHTNHSHSLSHTMNEASFDKMKKSKTSSGIKTTLQKSSTQNNNSLLNVVISPKIPHKILSPSHEVVVILFFERNSNKIFR